MKRLLLAGLLLIHAAAFAQTGKGSILGRVLRADGTPVAAVRVVALELPKAKGVYSADLISLATTDAEGRYRLSDVPPGRYGVFVNIRSAWDVSEEELKAAPEITVKSGASTVHDISLPPARSVTVSGRVLKDFVPRDMREVFLSAESRFFRARVDNDGVFSFRGIPPGRYVVTTSAGRFVWGSTEILVGDQNVAGIELVPDDPIPVTGRVVTEGRGPVPGFSFSLEGPKGSVRSAQTWTVDSVRSGPMVGVSGWADRPDDVIFDTGLPVGEYRITVTNLPPGYRVKSFTYGETNLLERPLRISGEIHQLSLVLIAPEPSGLAKVTGRLIRDVVLPRELVAESFVLRGNRLMSPLETAIRKDGSFELTGVPPGVYWVGAPNVGLKLVVGSEGVRGLEFRNSRIQARYDETVRALANPPPPIAELEQETEPEAPLTAAEERTPESGKGVDVSGRLTSLPNSGLEGLSVTLSGDSYHTASLDSDGRFVFTEIVPGNYSIHASGPGISSPGFRDAKRVIVGDTNIEDIELPVSSAKRTIRGRIVVEGGYPLPLVSLTVRPNVDSPPFVHPYTMRSQYPTDGGFVLQADGRFAIDLPDGRHRFRVDGYPENAYKVKSVRYGSANLEKELLEVDGENLKELLITFSAAPLVSWPKVKGRISGMGNIAEPIRVLLSSTRSLHKYEAIPKADGTFEFQKIPPDTYTVLTVPRVAAMAPKSLVVAAGAVPFVDLAIPAQRTVALRINVEQGSRPRNLSLTLTLSRTEAYTFYLSIPLVMRSAHETVCVVDVCGNSTARSAGEPTILSASPNDGLFSLRLPEGEYRVALRTDHPLTSLTHGAVDLLEAPLRIGPTTPAEINATQSIR